MDVPDWNLAQWIYTGIIVASVILAPFVDDLPEKPHDTTTAWLGALISWILLYFGGFWS